MAETPQSSIERRVLMFDFVVIDFETATHNNNSACSVGIVAVKDLKIVEEKYYLIKPPTLMFNTTNIKIHGITPDDVKNSPQFPEVWENIKHYFDGNFIVAYNARFDMSVLKSCMAEYGINEPNFTYLCSMELSDCVCEKCIGRSLDKRAQYFNIELESHHNAMCDAKACALLTIASFKELQRGNFGPAHNACGTISFYSFADLHPSPSLPKRIFRHFPKVDISEIAVTVDCINETNPFFGKTMVFTGELKSMERTEAMQEVINRGAVVKNSVSAKTDYLIVGMQDNSIVGDDGMSTKEEKAYALKEKGAHIQILTEDEFIKLL